MAYVTIDEAGNITGVFANPHPYLEGHQEIADDDPRIKPFMTRLDPKPAQKND